MRRLMAIAFAAYLVVIFPSARIAAQAVPKSAEQQRLQKERDELLAEAQEHERAGRLDDAVAVAGAVLAIDRQLHGEVHPAVVSSLEYLAGLYQKSGDAESAASARQEAKALKQKLEALPPGAVGAPAMHNPLPTLEQRQLDEAIANLNRSAQFYIQGNFRDAIPPARQALAVYEKIRGKKHADTAAALSVLGKSLEGQGEYAAARPYFEQALSIHKELYGTKHATTAISLTNLAGLLRTQGDYQAARSHYEQALAIRKEILGDTDLTTARTLNDLGVLHFEQGNYATARSHIEQFLAIIKQVHGEKHRETATALSNLASVLDAQGDFAAARTHYEQALAIRKEVLGDKHPDTAINLGSLAAAFHALGNYAAARSYSEQAVAVFREGLGDKHAYTANALSTLGTLLDEQGDYVAARRHFEQALTIYQAAFGEQHPETARTLAKLGNVLQMQGDYSAARPYYERALAIRTKVLGEKHPDTAKLLNDMGMMFGSQGDAALAKTYYERAIAIEREAFGDKNHLTSGIYNNLAALLFADGDYEAAMPHLEWVSEIRKEVLGDKHPDTASALCNVATVLEAQGNYAAARKLFEQVLAIRRDALGDTHPDTATTLKQLGLLLQIQGDHAAAFDHTRRGAQARFAAADVIFPALSEAEALNYAAQMDVVLISTWHGAGATAADLYDVVWPGRGALLQATLSRNRAATRLPEGPARQIYEQWLDARAHLARLILTPADADPNRAAQRRERLATATKKKEEIERQLATLVAEFSREQALARQTPADLGRALPPHSAFVDVLRYSRFRHDPKQPGAAGDSWTSSYAAFVIRGNQPAQYVDLGPAVPIDAAAQSWRQEILSKKSGNSANELRRLVWEPVQAALPADALAIYIVPEDSLTSIPWAALPGRTPGTVLLEDYAIAIVPSGKVLLGQLTSPTSSGPAEGKGMLLAVGGVSYSQPLAAQVDSKNPSALPTLRSAAVHETKPHAHWPELAGTLAEVDEAARLAGNRTVVKLTGAEASTVRVLQELPKARWATLATHGFFADPSFRSAMQLDEKGFEAQQFRSGDERTTVAGRNPLVLSGLVFAGANLSRPKDEWGVPQGDGGILTAEAIAGLNLSKMELAVLSACETGLGDVAGGEGVFGLQRAFHIAGCRNVIASLWKVDDQATSALMKLFYHKLWQENKPPIVALREAQLALYHHPEQIGKLATSRGLDFSETVKLADKAGPSLRSDPATRADIRLWAAFMLSGGGY